MTPSCQLPTDGRPVTSPPISTAGWSSSRSSAGSRRSWAPTAARPHWGKRHYQTAATSAGALSGVGPLPGCPRAPGPRRACSTTTTSGASSGPYRRRGRLMLTPAERLERYETAFAEIDAPFAFVDLEAMWSNSSDMLRRSAGKPIRIASKSLRCRSLMRTILDRDGRLPGPDDVHAPGDALAGAQRVREPAARLPDGRPRGATRAEPARRPRIPTGAPVVMVDSIEHLDLIDSAVGGHRRADPRLPGFRRLILARRRAGQDRPQAHPRSHARAGPAAGGGDRRPPLGDARRDDVLRGAHRRPGRQDRRQAPEEPRHHADAARLLRRAPRAARRCRRGGLRDRTTGVRQRRRHRRPRAALRPSRR